jgi:hypothetical protein
MSDPSTDIDHDAGPGDEHDRLIAAGQEAVAAATREDVMLRCLGGVAIALRCPSTSTGPLRRDFSDLDFATTGKHVKGVARVLKGLGFTAHDRFNAAHGHSRLLFAQPDGRHVDVFVDRFSLCHELPLRDRLATDPETVPIADLLLTKLQVAKLAHKDLTDTAALLHDHSVTTDDSALNAQRLVDVLANDWGWWRTSTETLERVTTLLPTLGLPDERQATIRARADELRSRIDAAPKSMRWRARARIGDRRPWREDPDEMEA